MLRRNYLFNIFLTTVTSNALFSLCSLYSNAVETVRKIIIYIDSGKLFVFTGKIRRTCRSVVQEFRTLIRGSVNRYERQGIILKNIIRMNKLCVTEKMRGNVDEDSEKLYILTFGNESCMQLPSEFLKSFIDEMDQSLSLLLVKHLKEVTCHMYLAWAEAKDPDNPLLSLQRAIITECIYFLKAAETEAKLWENQELLMCLDQLIGSQTRPQLTLEEIYHGVESGNLTDLKELLHYYPDWNETTLQFIKTKHHMLQNKDFEVLFKYLKYEFQLRRYTQRVYLMQQATIIEMLLQRNVKDIYDITLMFVVHHYRDNFLREQHNLDDFYALMENAIGLWHNPLFVKNLLVHILCSPQQILKALLHMAVDMTDRVVCSPQQLLLLRPFLCVKISEDQSLLTDLLYQLCMDPNLWELKKYTNLIIVMLSNFVTTPEDILNNVFIRYLAEQPFDHNINCILTSTCKIVDNFKLKSGVVHLCMLVVRKISNWRKCEPSKKRIQVNHVLSSLLHLLKKCVQKPHLMTVAQKRQVLDTVLPHIEPLDKATFSPLLYLVQGNVLSIIDDYARRCYAVRRKHKQARRDSKNIYSFLDNIQLQKQDFVRHMILHASDIEYQENCLNMTIKYWFFFGWINELDAFDNVTRITMEAIRVGLEYPENVPTDVFPVLLENCVQLTKMLSNKLHDKKKIKQILLKNMSLVLRSIQCPQQRITYGDLIKKLEGMVDNSSLAVRTKACEHVPRNENLQIRRGASDFPKSHGTEVQIAKRSLPKYNFPGILWTRAIITRSYNARIGTR